MKKLILFFLLASSVPLIRGIAQDPNPPIRVISIADWVLQSKFHNADPKKLDPVWLKDVNTLREMDFNMQSQLDNGGSSKNYLRASTCCPCAGGTGCCACDTTKRFISNNQIKRISLIGSHEKKKVSFKAVEVGNLLMFEPAAKIPDGKYILEVETSFNPPKFSIPVVVQDKKMNLMKR